MIQPFSSFALSIKFNELFLFGYFIYRLLLPIILFYTNCLDNYKQKKNLIRCIRSDVIIYIQVDR